MTKTIARFFSVALLISMFVMSTEAQDIRRTFDVSAGAKLVLDLDTGGDISILGWDRSQIEVVVTIAGRDKDDVMVDFDQNARGLEITTEFKSRRSRADVDVSIRVPKRFNINLSTTGGDVTIDDVEGDIEGSSMGGDVQLNKLTGTIDFSTMGGDITLTMSTVNGSLHTMGGDVDISDVTGTVKGTTMGGDVTHSNVKTGKGSSSDEVKINTMGGDVNVDEALNGADLHTMGGDIRVNKAAKFVKATTMGGDITVKEINGWIEANTMGGDLKIVMVGGTDGDRHAVLESMGGTIELTVPKGMSMEFDIEIELTKNAKADKYDIKSDFNVLVSKDSTNNRKRAGVISGTGSINGGRNKIKIRTTNGDVIIREGR